MILVLADEPRQQVDQILTEIGKVDLSISAVDAVELVSTLQLALSHPSMLGSGLTRDRMELIARNLGSAVGKHPLLAANFQAGWEAIDAARNMPPAAPKRKPGRPRKVG
jgi:hypothetical protein